MVARLPRVEFSLEYFDFDAVKFKSNACVPVDKAGSSLRSGKKMNSDRFFILYIQATAFLTLLEWIKMLFVCFGLPHRLLRTSKKLLNRLL